MKNIFAGIGVLIALFSIFFFLLVADKMVYVNDETIYDFELSHSIEGEELKIFAEQTGVTIRLVDFKDTSFGKKEMYVTFLNPNEDIELGKRPSVFPNENIVYEELKEKADRKIKYFTIQSNHGDSIKAVELLLNENGYEVSVRESEPVTFNVGMLFSSLNMMFFALLTVLLILSISSYYVYRLKEIGVLKLYGWSNERISIRLLLKQLAHIYIFSFICTIPFGIYVVIKDAGKFFLFLKICVLTDLFLVLVFIFATMIGNFCVDNVNQIRAIKNKKNNQLLFYVLILFKAVTTTLLVCSINNTISLANRIDATSRAIAQYEEYDFYKIRTAVVPEQNVFDALNQLIQSIDDRHVYNYGSPENLIIADQLSLYESGKKMRGIDQCSYTDISSNMLEILKIVDAEGNIIKSSQIDTNSDILLIPIHYKNEEKEILNYYQFDKEINIIYIQDKQIRDDILLPGYYIFDSVYHIQPLKKELYLNNGEVLFDKEGSKKVEDALGEMRLDKYSITVEELNLDYNIFKANIRLDLLEKIFHLVINILSYTLCLFAVITIFLELRKKEFGVYKLLGMYPIKTIGAFIVVNGIITVIVTMILNHKLTVLLLMETMIYLFIVYKYMKHKAITAIKGE